MRLWRGLLQEISGFKIIPNFCFLFLFLFLFFLSLPFFLLLHLLLIMLLVSLERKEKEILWSNSCWQQKRREKKRRGNVLCLFHFGHFSFLFFDFESFFFFPSFFIFCWSCWSCWSFFLKEIEKVRNSLIKFLLTTKKGKREKEKKKGITFPSFFWSASWNLLEGDLRRKTSENLLLGSFP